MLRKHRLPLWTLGFFFYPFCFETKMPLVGGSKVAETDLIWYTVVGKIRGVQYAARISRRLWGTRILMLGDAAALASRVLLKAPEKLACDMVQVAHHGSFGMSKEVYTLTGARVALWPAARYEMAKNDELSANRYLLYESGMKHILYMPVEDCGLFCA